MQTLGIWIAAFLTLGVFSWMYKENPWFRLCEHIYVGCSLGHLTVEAYQNIKGIAVGPLINESKYVMLVPLILGVLLFSRWTPKYAWLSRTSMGFLVGTTAAVVMNGAIRAQLLDQVIATMMPLNSVNNVIFVALTIAATAYFPVSYTHLDVYKRQGSYRSRFNYGHFWQQISDQPTETLRW